MNKQMKKASKTFIERVKKLYPTITVEENPRVDSEEAITHKVRLGKYSREKFETIEGVTLEIEEETGIIIHVHPIWEAKEVKSAKVA